MSAPSQEEITAGQAAPGGLTAASQRLVFDDLAGTADLIESYAICLKEAARRDDRSRVHGYLVEIVGCVGSARAAYGHLGDLAKLEARQ